MEKLKNMMNIKVYDQQKNIICEIKEGKGNMKEIDDYHNLIYEGEYLNGERNGKGKEYKYGKLIFEGEYLNGLRNGKVKEYYINIINKKLTLLFEGEYKNGKKWNGKGYDENGNIIYNICIK